MQKPLDWMPPGHTMQWSADRRYVIMRIVLREPCGSREVFVARKIDDPQDVVGLPIGWTLGRALGECRSWEAARYAAQRDAVRDAQGERRHVPVDYPAARLARFREPQADGLTRGALVVVRRGGQLVAAVLGMEPGERRYEPRVYAEVQLPGGAGGEAAAIAKGGQLTPIDDGVTTVVRPALGFVAPALEWVPAGERLWHDAAFSHVIVRGVLPERRPDPREVYILRAVDPAVGRRTLGVFVAELSSLQRAQQEAERHAARLALPGPRSVPEDLPALELAPLRWWRGDWDAMDALAVVHEGGRMLVQVVAMARSTGEPVVRVQIDATDLLQQAGRPAECAPRADVGAQPVADGAPGISEDRKTVEA